jgi:hypothetical protein
LEVPSHIGVVPSGATLPHIGCLNQFQPADSALPNSTSKVVDQVLASLLDQLKPLIDEKLKASMDRFQQKVNKDLTDVLDSVVTYCSAMEASVTGSVSGLRKELVHSGLLMPIEEPPPIAAPVKCDQAFQAMLDRVDALKSSIDHHKLLQDTFGDAEQKLASVVVHSSVVEATVNQQEAPVQPVNQQQVYAQWAAPEATVIQQQVYPQWDAPVQDKDAPVQPLEGGPLGKIDEVWDVKEIMNEPNMINRSLEEHLRDQKLLQKSLESELQSQRQQDVNLNGGMFHRSDALLEQVVEGLHEVNESSQSDGYRNTLRSRLNEVFTQHMPSTMQSTNTDGIASKKVEVIPQIPKIPIQVSLRHTDGRKVMIDGIGLSCVEADDFGSKFPVITDGQFFRLYGLPGGEDMKLFRQLKRESYLKTFIDQFVVLNESTGRLETRSDLPEGALMVDMMAIGQMKMN